MSKRRLLYIADDNSLLDVAVGDNGIGGTAVVVTHSTVDLGLNEEFRGSFLSSLTDNGNGVKIDFGEQTVELDYSQLTGLYALLEGYNKDVSDSNLAVNFERLERIN